MDDARYVKLRDYIFEVLDIMITVKNKCRNDKGIIDGKVVVKTFIQRFDLKLCDSILKTVEEFHTEYSSVTDRLLMSDGLTETDNMRLKTIEQEFTVATSIENVINQIRNGTKLDHAALMKFLRSHEQIINCQNKLIDMLNSIRIPNTTPTPTTPATPGASCTGNKRPDSSDDDLIHF